MDIRSKISLSVILCLIAISFSPVVDASGSNATLDPCQSDDDCRVGLLCAVGNNFCTPVATGCKCIPVLGEAVNCTNPSTICPEAEGCAKSIKSGNTICVSCNIIASDPNYVAATDRPVCVTTPTPVPKPSRSPGPFRRSLDLCSETNLCDQGFQCSDVKGEICSNAFPPCFCLYKNTDDSECSATKDCVHPDETCLRYFVGNSTVCGSCSALKTDPRRLAVQDDGKCDDASTRTPPEDYAPSLGLAGDACVNDGECSPGYTCLESPGKKCSNSYFCLCVSEGGINQNCSGNADCQEGELCAQGLDKNTLPQCTSLSVYLSAEVGVYTLVDGVPSRGTSVSYDSCDTDYDCVDGLFCTHLSDSIYIGGCLSRKGCTCTGPIMEQCTNSSSCRDKEICVEVPDSEQMPYCYSENVARLDPYVRPVSEISGWTPAILPSNGWASDSCQANSDCRGDLVCQHYLERGGSCEGRDMCVCKYRKSGDLCNSTATCGDGEVCVVVIDSMKPKSGSCVSIEVMRLDFYSGTYVEFNNGQMSPLKLPTPGGNPPSQTPSVTSSESSSITSAPTDSPTPSASELTVVSLQPTETAEMPPLGTDPAGEPSESTPPDDNAVCVDSAALAHLDVNDLVFKNHRRAAVLCDAQSACATPGHIVLWHNEPMMMRTYCQQAGVQCTHSVRMVNSPRLRKKLRLFSRTDGLIFTAFAARYATRVEEHVVSHVFRLGW